MRGVNRLASLLLGLTLLAGGALVAVEAILALFGHRPLVIDRSAWYATLSGTRLDEPPVRVVATTVLLLGLVVLVAELRRWQPQRIALAGENGWYLHRRSVQRRLSGVARGVPGVRRARVTLRRRGASWRFRLTAVGDPASGPALETAIRQELGRLGTPLAVHLELGPARQVRQRA